MKTKYKNITAFAKKTSSGEEDDELMNDDGHLVLFSDFRQKGAVFLSIVVIVFLVHFQLAGQSFDQTICLRAGVGFANQAWKPFGASFMKGNGKSIVNPYVALYYQFQVSKMFAIRSGFEMKANGIRDLTFPKINGALNRGNWVNTQLNYLTASGTFILFDYPNPKHPHYLGLGLGLEYLLNKKPEVNNQFPLYLDTYFDGNDYRSLNLVANLSFGLAISKYSFIEFAYTPSITRSLNVRQLKIRNSFFSVSLIMIVKELKQEKNSTE